MIKIEKAEKYRTCNVCYSENDMYVIDFRSEYSGTQIALCKKCMKELGEYIRLTLGEPKQENRNCDLVDRQTAIDRLDLLELVSPDDKVYIDAVLDMLEKLPPVEKTGKWVKASGYASPGGDPVWKCSECGKGVHVYGIEHQSYQRDIADGQWVACPNCGAKMKND